MEERNKILIIGGTGSLGYELVKRYISNNDIYVYSRDESKHWKMKIDFNDDNNLNFIIGNISDIDKIRQTLIRHNFNIIIMAAAMKHIDLCEFESNECINTNLLGTQNVLNEIENNMLLLSNLKKVCFISTDKACSPVNIYGMTKAISELLLVEKSKYIENIKFVCVRYGNVLNSRGSIIPKLHELGKNKLFKHFKLTSEEMTRFVMTLEQSVDLVEHALNNAESGDIVIPKLVSCRIKDLVEIFGELYNKPVIVDKLRPGEKMLESLINETQSMRMGYHGDYTYIKPSYKNIMENSNVKDYNSKINPLTKEELYAYLDELNLLECSYEDSLNVYINTTSEEYLDKKPFPYYSQQNFLPTKFALKCQEEILNMSSDTWDRYANPFENKYTLRDKNDLPKNCQLLFNKLTSKIFLDELSVICGETLVNDPTKNWWGIHKYDNGDSLDIHADAGIHPKTKQKKYVTLGIYLSSDWKEENGGHLEIWKGTSAADNNACITEMVDSVLPAFNTLIIFNNTNNAWHGNPHPVKCTNEKRIFLTLSYLTNNYSEEYSNKREKAFFVPLPGVEETDEKKQLRMKRADPEKYLEVYNCKNV